MRASAVSPVTRLVALSTLLAAVVVFWHATETRDAYLKQLWGLNQQHVVELREKLKARPESRVDGRLAFSQSDELARAPRVEPRGGRFDGPVVVTLEQVARTQTLHYTLDGSIPTERSPRYREPLRLDRTTVVRCRAFQPGRFGSDTVTHTYFVGETSALPLVSLVADPVTLWNVHSGIYTHPRGRGRAWERAASVEQYPAAGEGLRFESRLRIHGNISRLVRKKAFRLLYDGTAVQGDALLACGDGPREMILRQGGSNVKFRLQDELFGAVYRSVGGLTSACEPVVLFLNGEYWGLYNVRERINAAYVAEHAGEAPAALLTREGVRRKVRWEAVVGETKKLRAELETLDPAADLDVDAFVDYWLVNIYAANNDWPHYNQYVWRGQDGKWRPIAWDADAAFLPDDEHRHHDTLAWATRAGIRHDLRHNHQAGLQDLPEFVESTRWLRTLLRDEAFAARFRARMLELLDGPLHPDRVMARFEALVARTDRDVPRDLARWGYAEAEYKAHVEGIRRFIRERPAIVRAMFAGN